MTAPSQAGVDHIIWDWNGTLFDDINACVGAINQMLDERNLATLDYERYRDTFGFPVWDFYREVGFDLDNEDWDTLARDYHVRYLALSRDIPLRPGCRELLQCIKTAGLSMSVLSASEQSILDDMLEQRDVASFFQRVRGLDNLHAASKLDIGRQLLSDLGIEPRSALLIGDTTHDHDVASALDCNCLLLAGGHQSRARLEACGCSVASSLDDTERIIKTLSSNTGPGT